MATSEAKTQHGLEWRRVRVAEPMTEEDEEEETACPEESIQSPNSSRHGSIRTPSLTSMSSMMATWVSHPNKRSTLCRPRFRQKRTMMRRFKMIHGGDGKEHDEEPLPVEMLKKVAEKSTYTRCYCEENVYMLCQRVSRLSAERQDAGFDWQCFAVFISNEIERCPVWWQKAGADDDAPCLWDYHVVLYCVSDRCKRAVVVDLDTTLPVVCDAVSYVTQALAPSLKLSSDLHPKVRVVKGRDYLSHFASDRRHMRDGNRWLSPPPPYPPIVGQFATKPWNLDEYKNMDDRCDAVHMADDLQATGHRGRVMSIFTFCNWIEISKRDESLLVESTLHRLSAPSNRPDDALGNSSQPPDTWNHLVAQDSGDLRQSTANLTPEETPPPTPPDLDQSQRAKSDDQPSLFPAKEIDTGSLTPGH